MSSVNKIFPVVAGAVAGGAIALVIAGSTGDKAVTTTVVQPQSSGTSIPTSLSSNKGLTVNQIYRNASPGVVDIRVVEQSSGGSGINPFGGGGGGGGTTQGEGAGVVYDTNGNILTDEHVVSGATSVTVKFQDGRTASAKVLGTDPSTDVAVIHVDVPASELHPIALANSSDAQVGDPVVAIGSPFSLPETTTTGIVSQVGRPIQAPNQFTITGSIQTDAAINPGNSGGPLLDANGHLLGLNDQIQTNSGSNAGVGFAIPSNTVAKVANTIISGQTVKHAYVGVGLGDTSASGAGVKSVQPGSPATSAGLQQGDVITAVNGKAITSTDQFIQVVDGYAPGDTVTLTVNRGGHQQTIKLTLGTRPATSPNGG